MEGPKVLVFDAPGIVIRRERDAFEDAARVFNISLFGVQSLFASKEGDKLYRGDEKDFYKAVTDRLGLKLDSANLMGMISTLGRQDLGHVFQKLSEKYKLVLLAELPPSWFETVSRLNRLDALFTKIFVTGYSGSRPPEPEAYRQITMHLGVKPEECAYFSVVPRRVAGAAEVGMRASLISDLGDLAHEFERLGVTVGDGKQLGDGVVGGLYGMEMNYEFAMNVGKAFGTIMGPGSKVAVARDGTKNSMALRDPLISGCISSGCDVLDYGNAPTPLLASSVSSKKVDGAILVSDGGLPYPNVVFSFYAAGRIPGEVEADVINLVRNGGFRSGQGRFAVDRPHADYATRLANRTLLGFNPVSGAGTGIARPKKGVRVKLSPANSEPASYLLQRMGIGVSNTNFDLGVEISKNGSMARFTDEKGSELDGYSVFLLLAGPYTMGGGKVVCDYGCPDYVVSHLAKTGAKVVLTSPSSVYGIQKTMLKEEASIGYDGEDGYYFADTAGTADGAFAAVKVAEIIATTAIPISEAASRFPGTYEVKRTAMCEPSVKHMIFEEVGAWLDSERYENCLRGDLNGSTVFLMESGFPSSIRIRVRGKDKAAADEAFGMVMDKMVSVLNDRVTEVPGVIQRSRRVAIRPSELQG